MSLKKYNFKFAETKNWFMDKAEKLIPEQLIGKKEVIQKKYRSIYGKENVDEKIYQYRRDNLKRLLLISAGVLIVSLGFLISELSEGDYLLTNADGELIGIKAPSKQQIILPMEIGVFAEGEEKKESVIFASPKPKNKESMKKSDRVKDEKYINEDEQLKKIQREARLYIRKLEEYGPQDTYYLPTKSEDGEKINWYVKKSQDGLFLVMLFPLLCVFLYRSRYRQLIEEEIRTKKIVQLELSEFITKLILLLDAGLVMSAAFQKIVRDYEKAVNEEGLLANYFYQQLTQINHTLQEARGSFTLELKEFAHRSRIPEFIRLANIITDNYHMGSELVEKLTIEGEMLWFTRKKLAVEQGKLAEVKLSLPLMLLILSLLLITIAPVFLEM